MNKLYISIVIIGVLLSACGSSNESNEKIMEEEQAMSLTSEQLKDLGIEFGKLELVDFPEFISVRGIIDVPPTHRASINVFHGGYVKHLDLLPGQQVKKGALLFTLQNTEFIDMQKTYLEQKAELDFLEKDFIRQRQLMDEAISSEKKFKQAESDYLMAKVRLASLSEQLMLINIDPKKLTSENIRSEVSIYAPIDGFVSSLKINRGVFLTPEMEAMQIINSEHKHLELKVYEKDVARIKEGQQLRFSIDDSDQLYSGEVHMIEKSINQEDRTVQVHCHLPDENAPFIVGMYVEAEVQVKVSQVYALPVSAVVDMDGKQKIVAKSSQDEQGTRFDYFEIEQGRVTTDLVEVLNADRFLDKEIVFKGAFELIN